MSKALGVLLVGYFVMSVLWVVTLQQKLQLQDENKALKAQVSDLHLKLEKANISRFGFGGERSVEDGGGSCIDAACSEPAIRRKSIRTTGGA